MIYAAEKNPELGGGGEAKEGDVWAPVLAPVPAFCVFILTQNIFPYFLKNRNPLSSPFYPMRALKMHRREGCDLKPKWVFIEQMGTLRHRSVLTSHYLTVPGDRPMVPGELEKRMGKVVP